MIAHDPPETNIASRNLGGSPWTCYTQTLCFREIRNGKLSQLADYQLLDRLTGLELLAPALDLGVVENLADHASEKTL